MATNSYWPDTAAHGFVIRAVRTAQLTMAAIEEVNGPVPVATVYALRELGFDYEHLVPGAQAELARPVAGFMVEALVKAFPDTVVRLHAQDEFMRASSRTSAADAESTQGAVPESAATSPPHLVELVVERERFHRRPGSFTLHGKLAGDEDTYVLGNVSARWLPVLFGKPLADQLMKEADQFPDGHSYRDLDIELFPDGFEVPQDQESAILQSQERVGGLDHFQRIDAEKEPVSAVIRERGFERVWTVLHDREGREYLWPGFLGTHLTGAKGYAVTSRTWSDETAPLLWSAPATIIDRARNERPAYDVVERGSDYSAADDDTPIEDLDDDADFAGDDADLQAEQEEDIDDARPRGRKSRPVIADFGAKIGGARKDLAGARARGYLTVADMATWTELEREQNIEKSTVWPTPDYQTMVEDGMPREVAFWIKGVRDNLLSRPPIMTHHDPEERRRVTENYVAAVGELAERVQGIRRSSVHAFNDAKAVAAIYSGTKEVPYGNRTMTSFGLTHVGSALGEQCGAIVRARRGSRIKYGGVALLRYMADASGRDGWSEHGIEFGRQRLMLAERKYADWPDAKPGVKKAHVDRSDRDQVRPHLAHLQRVAPYGRDGRDVTEAQFMETFGFRAGEFGNWLTANDRQQVLNLAHDALADLAVAMDVPPRALSLGGTLAIAFGARGNGGRAAAHYEPGREVINLTKINGDGSLAHEWGHALDHWLYKQTHDVLRQYGSPVPFQSDRVVAASQSARMVGPAANANARLSNVAGAMTQLGKFPESLLATTEAFDHVMAALRTCRESSAEVLVRLSMQQESRLAYTTGWIRWGRGAYLDAHVVPLEARGEDSTDPVVRDIDFTIQRFLQAADQAGDREAVGVAGDELARSLTSAVRRYGRKDACQTTNLRNLEKVVRECGAELANRRSLIKMIEAMPSGDVAERSRTLQWNTYAKDALKRDETRSKPYYSLPHELFARAFESIVFDRLADRGIRSDYLVHGVEAGSMASAQHGSPYPGGDDRARLRMAFDTLFNALPTELMLPAMDAAPSTAQRPTHGLRM